MMQKSQPESRSFFRKEVYLARQKSWLGDIRVSRPLSFSLFTGVIVGILLLLVSYLSLADYTKKATATGYVTTDKGVITLTARGNGTIVELLVVEGDIVDKGAALAVLDVDFSTLRGPLQREANSQMVARRRLLEADLSGAKALNESELATRAVRQLLAATEIATVRRQIATQLERITIVSATLAQYKKMYDEGFFSELGLQDKSKELLAEKNALEALHRAETNLEKDGKTLSSEIELLKLKLADERRRINGTMAQLSIEEIQSEGRRQLVIVAPIDGKVTGILVSVGRAIKDNQSVLTIVPKNAQLQVDLYVPTKSAAALKTGVLVAMQHRAFPYEKFGMQRGTVISVSSTALPAGDLPYPVASGELYFLVAVKPLPFIHPDTKMLLELRPGMMVDGRIELETRSLLRWLIEPLDRLLKNT